MRNTLLLLLLVSLPIPAHAGRYWATFAKIGSGETIQTARRPAMGTLKKKAISVAVESADAELVLVVIDDKDLSILKSVAAKVHGKESTTLGASRNDRISAALHKKLVKEAKRLGASAEWVPENYDTVGE